MAGSSPAKGNIVADLMLHLPPVIGHRGAAAHAPENTPAGFRAAKALGCGWVEFDVRLTADGVPVVCHDDRLDRTTDGRGRISKMPLVVLREMDAGRWFGAAFAGERIPTLEDTLLLCRELDLGANVEIKAERGRGPATASAVSAVLSRFAHKLPPVLVSSFMADAVAAAAEAMPDVSACCGESCRADGVPPRPASAARPSISATPI